MGTLIWSLVAALLVLLAAVMVPIWSDRPWEHAGADEDWSPLAEVGPAATSHEFAMGTGWPT